MKEKIKKFYELIMKGRQDLGKDEYNAIVALLNETQKKELEKLLNPAWLEEINKK